MKRWSTGNVAAALVTAAVVAPACGPMSPASRDGAPGPPQRASELLVFAASSLTEAFGELAKSFEAAHPEVDVKLSLESSSTLAAQIVEGAPADVYASADQVQMGMIQDEGLAVDPVAFATNRLVIVTPAGNPAGIEALADLAGNGVKLVLAAPEVPVGSYARVMLERLGVAEATESNVVSNEEDVKAVVAKVRLGEADAGVIYRTDLTQSVEDDLELIDVPAGASPVAVYPITVVRGTDDAKAARAWVRHVLSPEGQRVLRSLAFGPPAQ